MSNQDTPQDKEWTTTIHYKEAKISATSQPQSLSLDENPAAKTPYQPAYIFSVSS